MPGYVTHRFPKRGELICEDQLLTDLLYREFKNIALFVGLVCFSISVDVENSWAELWKSNFELNPDLHLPAENKYIGQ